MSTIRPDALLPPRHAAEHLGGCSESYLAKLRMTGEGPPYVKIGRRVFYKKNALDSWIASNTRSSTSDDGSRAKRAERGG